MILCQLMFILCILLARDEISQIVNNLHVGGGDTIIKKAHRFYEAYISIIISVCCLNGMQHRDTDVSSF